MIYTRAKPGFILVLTVGLMAVMTLVVARMLTDLLSFRRLETVLFDREQAKQLAWSGVQMAIAQLLEKKPAPQEELPEAEEKFQKQLFELRKIMMRMNRWQKFSLSPEDDGVSGSCRFYIACEQGKLNPALWASAVKAGVEGDAKKRIEQILHDALQRHLSGKLRSANVLQRLSDSLAKRKNELWDDVSELLEDDELKSLKEVLFLTPTSDWALTDFFSLDHSSRVLQPWALSRSLTTLAGLTPEGTPDDEAMKKIGDTVQQARPAKETWDIVLETLYHKTLPQEWYVLLSTKFETDVFSVISYGTYRDIIVKLYAIVQRKREKGPDGNERDICFVKKIYWIYD